MIFRLVFLSFFWTLVFLVPTFAQQYEEGVILGNINREDANEISGLTLGLNNPEILYGQNDSGGGPFFYAMATDGTVLRRYRLSGALAQDMEDIDAWRDPSTGKSYLYLADTGDNDEIRNNIRIYRVEEPAAPLGAYATQSLSYETFHLSYPDGARDCEAMFIEPETGHLYMLTKRDSSSRIYRYTSPMVNGQNHQLSYMGQMAITFLTAGDISPDRTRVIVKSHDLAWQYDIAPGQTLVNSLQGTPTVLAYTAEKKGESVTFNSTSDGFYTTSEGRFEPIYYYARADTVDPDPDPIGPGLPINTYLPGVAVGVIGDSALDEASGLASSNRDPNILWSHNDDTNDRYIYAMGTNGVVYHRFNLVGAPTIDIEDIAAWTDPSTGGRWLYVFDTGDKNLARDSVNIYRLPEPVLGYTAFEIDITNYETITFQYPDEKHDTESGFVDPDTGDIYMATKNDVPSKAYRLAAPYDAEVNMAQYLGTMQQVTALSAADIRDDGKEILFRSLTGAWRATRDPSTTTIAQAMMGPLETIPFSANELKGEGITFDFYNCGYFTTTEVVQGLPAPIHHFPAESCGGESGGNAVMDILEISTVITSEGLPMVVTAVLGDPIADTIFSATGLPPGAILNPVTGTLNWTPGESNGGQSWVIVITATDPTNPANTDSEPVFIEVIEANQPPILGALPTMDLHYGGSRTLSSIAIDLDVPIQQLTYYLVNSEPGASINPSTGEITFTPNAGQVNQDVYLTVGVRDNGTPSLSATQTMRVNVYPPIVMQCRDGAVGILVDWTTIPGHRYQLESNHKLEQDNWTFVKTITATGNLHQHVDTTSLLTGIKCYYRVAYLGP